MGSDMFECYDISRASAATSLRTSVDAAAGQMRITDEEREDNVIDVVSHLSNEHS